MKYEDVSTSQIRPGDTILLYNNMKTVGIKDIKNDPFVGVTIFGTPFVESGRKVKRVLFCKWYKNQIVDYVSQL